ncbi:MAG: bifunctional 4-hydroxy-2-oxoglutarate aldolase/2-dehydro-3-deoxy-phosphogluconate aldolase [Acidobacteriaceae bacterium]
MTKEQVVNRIREIGIVPVIRANSADMAIRAAEAVCAGGIPIVEVTMTVPGAIEAISKLVQTMGSDLLVGAGTVLDAEAARKCLDAGADFLVSPGTDLPTIKVASGVGQVMITGALTPTEIMTAWKAGSDFVKIFPCGNLGGPSYIRALRGPFPDIPMIPTGGVNLQSAGEFLRAGAVALGIGGELISAAALGRDDMQAITETARKYFAIVQETRTAV